MARTATVTRNTRETQLTLTIDLDGTGRADLHTGIGFFDHMLDGFARHGLFDVSVTCRGDLDVDCHHTIEDIGIALGTAIKEALGDKAGLVRYGSCMLPMDETLALCAVDLGGRPYFVYDASFAGQSCGGMDTQMAREFFYAVSYSAMMNLHLKVLYGENDHHKLEAMFKAFAKALDAATRRDARRRERRAPIESARGRFPPWTAYTLGGKAVCTRTSSTPSALWSATTPSWARLCSVSWAASGRTLS